MLGDLVGHGIRCQGKTYEIVGVTAGDRYAAGGDEVFDVFDLTEYTFLEISRGGVMGDGIVKETDAYGVFKLRSGMNVVDGQETKQSDATLHIKPTEPFLKDVPSNREFYRVTLQERSFE